MIDNGVQLKFKELTSNGTKHISLEAPDQIENHVRLYLPDAYPSSNGQALVATTGGEMSWASTGGTNVFTFVTEVVSSSGRPFPEMEMGKYYYLKGNGNSSTYVSVPDFNQVPVGSFFNVYNGCTAKVYVSTFEFSDSGNSSSNQKIYRELETGTVYDTQHSIANNTRHARVCLVSRTTSPDLEKWLLMVTF